MEESARDGNLLHYFAPRRHHQRHGETIKLAATKRAYSGPIMDIQDEGDRFYGVESLLDPAKVVTAGELMNSLLGQKVSGNGGNQSSMRAGAQIFAQLLNNCKTERSQSSLEHSFDVEDQWNFLMISETILLANIELSSSNQIIHLINQLERRIIFEKIWRSEKIYELLRSENSLPSTRRKKQCLKSPGKALKSMTDHTDSHGVSPLEYFFRKLLRTSSILIEHLVNALLLSEGCWRAIWTLYMRGLEEEDELRLNHNRSVLTVIACCVYSMGKMHDESKTFAEIISCSQTIYSDFGHDWYKKIEGLNGELVDIVHFYNQIYLPKMKDAIYSSALLRLPPSSHYNTPKKVYENDFATHTPIPRQRSRTNLTPRIVLEVSPGPLVKRDRRRGSTTVRVVDCYGLRNMPPISEGLPQKRVARKLNF